MRIIYFVEKVTANVDTLYVFLFLKIYEAIRSFTLVTREGKLKFQLKWNMLNFILGNLRLINVFINCNWVVTR
jgi:hypothetical protein